MIDRRCLVAICHNGPVIFTETAQSLMEIGWGNRVEEAKAAHGFAGIDFAWSKAFPRVDSMRDWIVQQALKHKAGYTHVLFLDADMVWPTDVLMRMLKHHDKGIVSGHYCLKSGDFSPVAMKHGFVPEGGKTTQYVFDTTYRDDDGLTDADGLRTVDVIGMGCALIPLAVFRTLERPWFHYEDDDDGWPRVSEDVPFCRKAQAAGYRIAWDPAIECGHLTTKTVTPAWHVTAVDGLVPALLQGGTL